MRGTALVAALLVHAAGGAPAMAKGGPRPGTAAWRQALSRVATPVSLAEMERETVVPAGAVSLRGARAKLIVRDSQGRKYLFKQHDPAQTWMEREHVALVLRGAGREPHVPIVVKKVKLPDGRELIGSIKPFVESEGDLKANPRIWTAGQRAAVMADHAWAEFLGNYDTKTDQSLIVRAPGLAEPAALNVDWDLTLTDYGSAKPVSRYKAMNSGPPAHNLLYNAYVHGRIDLDFRPLRDAVTRIQAIPDAKVVEALQPFLAKAFAGGKTLGPFTTPASFVAAVLERKAGLGATFDGLVRDLRAERAEHAAGRGRYGGLRKLRSETRDAKMITWGKFIQSSAFARFQQVFRRFAGDLPPESAAFTR